MAVQRCSTRTLAALMAPVNPVCIGPKESRHQEEDGPLLSDLGVSAAVSRLVSV